MIADFETNIVYFSDLLRTKDEFIHICSSILEILDKYNVQYDFLHGTNDIWARDYMPIQTSKDRFIQFRYEPTYLNDYLELHSDTKLVCQLNNIQPIFSEINIDGGNIVKWTDKVLLTDRIYTENPQYSEKNRLVREIENLLETEVIIIPQIKSDFTGHADGLVKFIDEKTIFSNDLNFELKYWTSSMRKVFDKYNFEFINMPMFEYKDKQYSDTAIGCYMNYLEIGNVIIFPIFDVPENKDKQAVDLIKSIFPHKHIEPININEIARHGGLMNCISWNIKK
jgi:agmatine deiminase